MRILKFVLILCSAVFTLFACGKKKDAVVTAADAPLESIHAKEDSLATLAAQKDTFLIYHRGACYGMCPIFDLVVYMDGSAVYEGRNFVDLIGFYQTKMDATALQKITDQANAIGYFGLQEKYDNPNVTDLPTTRTGISKDGKLKMVSNRYKGPAGLKMLYDAIDKTIAAQKWEPMGK